jgi:molybdopterin-containing oxidoreductase family iron-sulfur binding subunit
MNAVDALRASLPSTDSPRFWRALDELVDDPVRRAQAISAWPALAEMEPSMDRRGFLRLLAASLAFAGLTACSGPPPDHIVPEIGKNARQPASRARYATAIDTGGDVVGVLVNLRDGRPIKIEGNPRHPASLGGSDPRMQASILDLWDPARSSAPRNAGVPSSWADFETEAASLRAHFANGGDGLRILSSAIRSPTLSRQRDAVLTRYPQARWHVHEPMAATTTPLRPDVGRARVIVTFDADLLGTLPGHVRHARDFSARRTDPATMSRLYAIEPTPSLTGRNADHAWAASARDMPAIVEALAAALSCPTAPCGSRFSGDTTLANRIQSIADDLLAHPGESIVLAGPWLPASVQAQVRLINQHLGNLGRTVHDMAAVVPASGGDFAGLVADMHAGSVDTLLILESNPGYSAAGGLQFSDAMQRVRQTMHFGRYRDETAALARWHLPALHPFETWSDLLASDGTASIVQPVLRPLADARSAHDVIDLLLGGVADDPRGRVRATWPALASEGAWNDALRGGVVSIDGTVAMNAATGGGPQSSIVAADQTDTHPPGESEHRDTLELVLRPDENLWDGRHANNGWLQELPRAVTSLTWGNAALVSPALAKSRGLEDGDIVRLELDGRSVEAPVLVLPGQATHTVTLTLGHGRRSGLSKGLGHDAYALLSTEGTWHADGVTLTPTGRRETLASTQLQQDMGRRDIIRTGTPAHPPQGSHAPPPPSFYPDKPAGEYRWGMSIDLAACIGCNACTIACQSENNIPVVGKEEVKRGRRMHWIRVDRYHLGETAEPSTFHQPVPCMHCEHAPCEVVCPVEATVHDSEGLNLQVYNRCIGTRFCSNNCPYKVRRFNFLQYADFASESLKAMRNPEVTIRQKGVMEKCTYCVQRIEQAHIAADRDTRRIAEGEVTTACQDACPTRAIVFGDLGNARSAVSIAQASPRRYVLLEELNTRPRTTYLAALRNPNPAWDPA